MQRTRSLTEGAILSGLFIILMLLTIFVPPLVYILLWFMPLPFLIYTARYGLRSALVMFVVLFLLSLFIGGLAGVPFVFMFGLGGITVGEMIRRKNEPLFVLTGGSLAYITSLMVIYAVTILVFNINPVETLQNAMRDSFNQAESMLNSIGQDGTESIETMNDAIVQIGYMIPVIMVGSGAGFAVITQAVAHYFLKRLSIPYQPFPPFREWNFPKSLLWYYLAAIVLTLIGAEEGTTLYLLIWNVYWFLGSIMIIQGCTVVFYYCYKKSLPKALPIIFVISLVILPIIPLFARILGIIDLGFRLKERLETDKK
ncbi:uncharacterized protein YybS (DUF2232 family) [Sinobaca qinghaiensis]|uniref:Uncharacterized protein YybS (DUF2232 family) n=1 Tax=Sinobaca qinghaiensis TaxID=342944 RepID=A0A419UUA2_9BACL|nr:YybS family protein [Sinobaca qinghaiensis]RKD68101.1 uncharacterized protein YybS (DUF2232 family) [Sinobaca qinghaiensis]